jgi:hypothetical protein
MVNQAVHPSGVGKLVAISMQWVVAVEDCEVTRAAVRWLVCGLCGRMAQIPHKLPHVGFLQLARATLVAA